MRIKLFLITCFALIAYAVHCQGIKGYVFGEDSVSLPFSSIYIKEAGIGTSANSNGYYELQLTPGTYEITYQFLGYTAQTKNVVVTNGFKIINVKLEPEVITLNTVTITEDAEDPAYTIMRKAIAKAKFHLLQTNSYSAEVYTKGTGEFKKVPWAIRKMAESQDEELDTNTVFTSESVSEYYFERPNTFKEKIISVRTSGEDDNSVQPNQYFNTSFYLPNVVGAVSPLSPSAFSYYRFEFLGSFEERGYEINKIKVTPRSKGDAVYEGIIYIRENFWNIHSLFLDTKFQGFNIHIEQIFGPVLDEIWMPVTNQLTVNGSIFGLEIEYNYLASVSNYKIDPNTDLNPNITVLDVKIDPVPEELKKEEKQASNDNAKEQIKEDQKLTNKRLAELVEAYEEQENEEKNPAEKNVVSNVWFEIDSTATKKDSAYWANRRPVPLTEKEVKGYKVADSAYVVEKQDSLEKRDGRAIQVSDLFFGGNYALGERARFRFKGFLPEFRFNTVEGFNLDFTGRFYWRDDTTLRLNFTPNIRYGFSSGRPYGTLNTSFGFGRKLQRNQFTIYGGKYIYQFNRNAINPLINSLYSLFLARNYMKLYEQSFVDVLYSRQIGHKVNVEIGASYAVRNQLANRTDYSFFKPNNREYLSNTPQNAETIVGPFNENKAFTTTASFIAQPWLKFRRYNGKLIAIPNSSPIFRATYKAGWDGILGSATDFQQLEIGAHTEFKLGVRASLELDFEGGTFLNANTMQFMDFKHFNGGLTEFAPLSLTGNYRLLDYYMYSTQSNYVSLLSYIHFRKFLFTQFSIVRLSGVKESLFFNYLKTSASPHYWEAGYTIDNIFRILRIEFVHSFYEFQPQQFGIRIGVTSLLRIN